MFSVIFLRSQNAIINKAEKSRGFGDGLPNCLLKERSGPGYRRYNTHDFIQPIRDDCWSTWLDRSNRSNQGIVLVVILASSSYLFLSIKSWLLGCGVWFYCFIRVWYKYRSWLLLKGVVLCCSKIFQIALIKGWGKCASPPNSMSQCPDLGWAARCRCLWHWSAVPPKGHWVTWLWYAARNHWVFFCWATAKRNNISIHYWVMLSFDY